MRNINSIALSAPDTASINGSPIPADQLVSASFQAVFADATAVGTVQIQASNDINNAGYNASNFQPTNWSNIPSASVAITAGAVGLITIPNVVYQWIRVVYTRTSGGSSTMVVNMNAFGV